MLETGDAAKPRFSRRPGVYNRPAQRPAPAGRRPPSSTRRRPAAACGAGGAARPPGRLLAGTADPRRAGSLAPRSQVVALAFVAWPWVRPDLLWNDVADAPNHLVRIFVVGAALGRGQGYPRWLGDLYLGYGYPLLNYYAPGLYYLGAGLHRLGLSVYASLQWAGVLAAAGGAAGAYALARALDRRGGTRPRRGVGLLPRPLPLPDQPLRPGRRAGGAGPGPPALAAARRLARARGGPARGGRVGALALAGLTAALLLTHNISALIGLGLLTGWLLLLPLVEGRPGAAPRGRTAGAVGPGLRPGRLLLAPRPERDRGGAAQSGPGRALRPPELALRPHQRRRPAWPARSTATPARGRPTSP